MHCNLCNMFTSNAIVVPVTHNGYYISIYNTCAVLHMCPCFFHCPSIVINYFSDAGNLFLVNCTVVDIACVASAKGSSLKPIGSILTIKCYEAYCDGFIYKLNWAHLQIFQLHMAEVSTWINFIILWLSYVVMGFPSTEYLNWGQNT